MGLKTRGNRLASFSVRPAPVCGDLEYNDLFPATHSAQYRLWMQVTTGQAITVGTEGGTQFRSRWPVRKDAMVC